MSNSKNIRTAKLNRKQAISKRKVKLNKTRPGIIIDKDKLYQRVCEIADERGVTLADLARDAGVTPAWLNTALTSKSGMTLDTLAVFAHICKTKPGKLCDEFAEIVPLKRGRNDKKKKSQTKTAVSISK